MTIEAVGAWIDISTAVGAYRAMVTPAGISRLLFPGQWTSESRGEQSQILAASRALLGTTELLRRELVAYHVGGSRGFSVPLDLAGHTTFQVRVWRALLRIPFGVRVTYGEIARQVRCSSARAVGRACGANPIPVIVPCHRVVAARGKLGGWSGPVGFKRKLLDWEQGQVRACS